MAIMPKKDKDLIQAVLINDAYLNRAGFNKSNIFTTNASSDLLTSGDKNLKMFISLGRPENSNSDLIKNIVYKITIVGDRDESTLIDSVGEQVIALLHDKLLGGGNNLRLLDSTLELESNPAIYVTETTFLCQCTNLNKVQR